MTPYSGAVLRRVVPTIAVLLLLGGCGAGEPPTVLFDAAGNEITVRPAQYCDLALTACDDDATAPVTLDIPPGIPLRIEVPGDIAEAPWHLVFRYRTATGEQVDGRSPLFAPRQRTEYTLELPSPTDQLLTAQVQQFGPPPRTNDATGEVEFPIRASWVLVTPALDATTR